jgi:GntR family transcriptional regulator
MKYKLTDELGELKKYRGVTYYHQLYTLLSSALSEGVIAPGSALPTETEFMDRFGISRNTVRRALGQLEKEKRIVRRRGSGSYARRSPKSETSSPALAEVLHDFRAADMYSSSRLVRVQSSPTPHFIRARDPQFGERSLLVQRCRSFRDKPFLFSSSYIPEELGARLTRRQLATKVVLSALEEVGYVARSAEQTTTAVTADAFTARHLGVDVAAALLSIRRLVRDAEGRSIEYQSLMFRPDQCDLRSSVVIERSAVGIHWSEARPVQMPAAL